MNIKNILSVTEARNNFFKITDHIQKSGAHFTLTEYGRPKVVVMSANEFESWQETLEVIRDFPDLDKDIKEAEKDYKSGNYITLETILAKEGFILTDKSKKKYEISHRRAKKSTKRFK